MQKKLKIKILLKALDKKVFIHNNWKSAWNQARTLALLNDDCYIISKGFTIIVDTTRKGCAYYNQSKG